MQGVCSLDNLLMHYDYKDLNSWAIESRIAHKKKKIIIKCVVQVKTESITFQMYQNQKEICDKYQLKLSSK